MNLNIYRKFVHHSVIITELSRKLHVDYVLQYGTSSLVS